MDALTPAERRGALVVVLLLALGAVHDLWRAGRPLPRPAPAALVDRAGPPDRPMGSTVAERPAPAAAGESGLVDLNRASARELDALPGIGPVLAARIVAHRERHGPFANAEELLAVRGIGPRLLARLAPRIRAGAPARRDTVRPMP